MGAPSITADDLRKALARYRLEARPGTLDTGRYRMRYAAWGVGPPLLFVHGMADVGRSFALVMHRLVDRFTCIAYELPDGTSDGAALGRYTHREYVADLLALLDHFDYPEATVLGSSFGSTIALAALAAAPHRFAGAVVQGGFARRPLTRGQLGLARLARFWPGWFGDWPTVHRWAMAGGERPVFGSVPAEVWEFFVANSGRTAVRAAALRALTIARTDLRARLPGIRSPLLMIGGDCDPLVPRRCEREIEDGVPDVRRVEIARCGHYPQYTHPNEMADAIRAFLDPGREPGARR